MFGGVGHEALEEREDEDEDAEDSASFALVPRHSSPDKQLKLKQNPCRIGLAIMLSGIRNLSQWHPKCWKSHL